MKFYGVGAVWGGEDNKILCRFIDGELETDDEKVIKKLTDNGYKHDGKQDKVIDEVPADATNEEVSAVDTPEVPTISKEETVGVPISADTVPISADTVPIQKPVVKSAQNAQVKKVVKK